MKIIDIYNILDKISAFSLQEEWDNSGLLIGDLEDEVQKIYLSIDVDEKLIQQMDKNSLLITHHPIIFSGLKQLQFNKYPARLIKQMIKKNIANIAMHTNFDKTHLNEYVATKILKLKIVKQEGFVIYMKTNEDFDTLAKKVSKSFGFKQITCVKTEKKIRTVALVTGSGASLIGSIQADCLLTGDIKYHDAMKAKSIKLGLIDIGHYESEQYFAKILSNHLKNLELMVIISQSQNPFIYMDLFATHNIRN